MTWLKLAIREILNNRKFAIFFTLNLALGLTGFILLDSYKVSLQNELHSGSRVIHTGDLSIRSANRRFTAEEERIIKATIPTNLPKATNIRLFSMAASNDASRLSRVVAISDGHPLYGTIELRKAGKMTIKIADTILQNQQAWVYPEILVQLGLKIGDSIKIGDLSFVIADVVEQDTSGAESFFGFAPKIFIGLNFINKTNLIRTSSRYNQHYFYKVPEDVDLKMLAEDLKEKLTSPELKITTHFEASQNLERSMTYIADYLGLIALIALFLAAMGSAYLFRGFLLHRLKEIATLMSLGATGSEARFIYILQVFLLGVIAAVLSLAFTFFLLPIIPILAQGLLPIEIEPHLNIKNTVLALIMGSFGSILICLPLLARVKSLKPGILFQEAARFKVAITYKTIFLYLPVLALYWLLAIWESNSVVVGSIFIGAFASAAIIFSLISSFLFNLCSKFTSIKHFNLRIALRNLARNKMSTGSCFLAISLGAMLIALVPQLKEIIFEEVTTPKGYEQPSLFLVDIQEDQLDELKSLIKNQGTDLEYVSPMIRARLTSLNGKSFERYDPSKPLTREQQKERWLKVRGHNLSFRPKLTKTEKIVDGQDFSGTYDWKSGNPAEVSLEMRFAERLGLEVGNNLTFDVQGVAVTGRVVNTRRIKWTSFQPNFFVQFQPGVLDDAPKTFLATIPQLSKEKKFTLQNTLVKKYPNISILDVSNTISRIMGILGKMSWIIQIMAYFALGAGFVVLYSIANHQAQIRRWDTNLVKILGANFRDIRLMVFYEFGILGFAGALCGGMASFVVSFLFTKIIFDSPWSVSWLVPIGTIFAITIISIFTSLVATNSTLKEKPLAFLNEAQKT